MLYREAGQFKSTYLADSAIFPIRQDRIGMAVILALAFVVVPLTASPYIFSAILVPTLILALAAIGLNILTGYAGQLSLGSAAFMAVGAFASFNFILRIPGIPILVAFAGGGLCAAAIGIVFGLPSLRIRGFYLAVATLAAQFFIIWFLTKVGWVTNYNASGVITAQPIVIFGYRFDAPAAKYLLVLSIVALMALAAKNLTRGNVGRKWMAIRDMDVAAEVIGIPQMRTKLLAFAVSSFYCGVAGALFAYAYLGTVEPEAYNLDLSFRILFMVIIGGAGTILGSFLGSAFIVLTPIVLNTFVHWLDGSVGLRVPASAGSNLEVIVFGVLIIFFLVVEPLGLARLWSIGKEKLRLWPFPH
ncbi:MAG TPA: branched-chain amino acid ABC transporter permease [Casimicrobiaceae bacterium]|jgi:branched-chain amino acid transport system permease protein|nr:branched-chain amino acid ABC transporter permease [Casimicrobiaceae bacterium]